MPCQDCHLLLGAAAAQEPAGLSPSALALTMGCGIPRRGRVGLSLQITARSSLLVATRNRGFLQTPDSGMAFAVHFWIRLWAFRFLARPLPCPQPWGLPSPHPESVP